MTESTSTALRGLLMSGGPLPSGDLRRIEVRRGDRVVATIDAYKFVIDGDKSSDPQLQPGDVIFVPPAKGYAAMAGSVHRPMIYHLTEGMVLADLLKAAGGLSMNLGQAKVQLERMPDGRREVERFILTEADLKRPVANGDLFMILPIDTQFRETVTLRGNVDRALRQQWRDGMRVSDLIGSPSNLVRPAIWSDLNKREDLAALESSRRDTTLRRDFPEVEWDHAMIERLDPVSLQVSFLPFNLGRALMRDALHNLTLQPGDSVVIYAKGDFQQPQRKRTRLVKVEGEVNSPGIYPVALDETLPEVLARAGGLTSQAYVYGTEFLRERVREAETKRHRQAVDMIEQDYLRYLTGRARNATTNEEAGISTVEYESVRNLVARLREFQPLGRIPLNLSNHKATFSSYPGVRLEDNDVISVPPRLSTVTVVGIVFQEGAQLWVPGWTVHDYIQNAGGERPHADLPNAVILRADGTVRQVPSSNLFSTNWGGTAEINPGDTIMVPENVTRTTWGRIFRDWSQIFYQLGLGAAAVQVFKINSTK
jgi:protein involved in polysaccharide export with SLBB domain